MGRALPTPCHLGIRCTGDCAPPSVINDQQIFVKTLRGETLTFVVNYARDRLAKLVKMVNARQQERHGGNQVVTSIVSGGKCIYLNKNGVVKTDNLILCEYPGMGMDCTVHIMFS
jgi:hypothetical protein